MASKKEPTKKRRGKAVKPQKGEAATFEAGSATPPAEFDTEKIASDLHLFWEDGDGQTFVIGQNPRMVAGGDGELVASTPQVWSRWPERKVVNALRLKWVRVKAREGEILSEAERVLLHVMKERRLGLVITSLAGYPAGIHEMGGERCLVRTSPRLVEPKEGDWSVVQQLLESKLDLSRNGGSGPNQTEYFHGWMRTALEGLYLGGPGNFRPGQCLVFAGPRDSGKSRIQHQVITGLLGGRSADPGPYLFGRTDFNGEMFAAEHLMMEDPASSTKTVERVYFGEMLKQLVVNDTQRLHRKREDALVVSPFFRVTISINDDPDKMRVLPLLTPDMKDKVMLFMVSTAPLPMPTSTLAERSDFRRVVAEQLPAYAWWLLNEFEVAHPSVRFGVAEYHHPSLAMELFDDTPPAEFLQIIDAAEFRATGEVSSEAYKLWDLRSEAEKIGEEWEGAAMDLERLLLGEDGWVSSVAREMKKLVMHNKVDRMLSRLKEDQPTRVAPHRTKIQRRWIIRPPE
jgi:hypothetical protein